MVQHIAKWDDCCATAGTIARAEDELPDTCLLMLLDLVQFKLHIAALVSALMLHILDHGECEQAPALAHGNPACGTVQPSLPVGNKEILVTEFVPLQVVFKEI